MLCFLGFVNRYHCLPANQTLTVGLYLNHKLFEAFMDYLSKVRKACDGTIAEALTGAISACRWLYRKERNNHTQIQIIRRYMDYRNSYQTKAAHTRRGNDVEELQEQNKWIGETF